MDKTTTRLNTCLKERTTHKKETYFSNSLRIHQVKTKKFITVKGGLDTMNFDDFTAPSTLLFLTLFYFIFLIEKIYQTLQTLFYRLLKQFEFLKTTSLRVEFTILCSVFDYPDETLSVVCDIYYVV